MLKAGIVVLKHLRRVFRFRATTLLAKPLGVLWFCVVAWILWSAMLLPAQSDVARRHYQEGVAHEQSGDLAAARKSYESAIVSRPDYVEAIANLGLVYLRLGDVQKALAHFEEARRLRPEARNLEFYAGLAHYQSGDYPNAIQRLKSFVEAFPKDARGLHLLGLCWLRIDNLEQGVQYLQQAVSLQPGNIPAFLSLATAYVSQKQIHRATGILEGPLNSIKTPEKDLVLGMILNANGAHLDALATLRRVIAANPKLPGANNQLGYTQMLLGDDPAAIESFKAELRLDPTEFNANANLGWILVRERRYREAAENLAVALARKPTHPGVRFLVGQVQFAQGDLEKAQASLELVAEQRPEFRAVHVLLGRVYAKRGFPEKVKQTQQVIARLTEKEQQRNLQDNSSYGGTAAMSTLDGSRPDEDDKR